MAGAEHRIDAPEASSYFTEGAAGTEDEGMVERNGGMMSWLWLVVVVGGGVKGPEGGKQPKLEKNG